MTGRPTTLNLEAVKRALVGSVLTYGDSDCAGAADRFSVSGTASRLRGKLGWHPITASSRKQSTIALSSGDAELVAALSGACGRELATTVEMDIEVWMQCRGDK